VTEAATDVRRTLFDLRGLLFDLTRSEQLDATADERIRGYVRGVAERWKLPVEATIDVDDLDEVDDATIEVARQVIREAIANTAKHADASTIRVALRTEPGTFVVEILDDGRGYDPASVRDAPGHMGLSLIRERVAEAGGTFGIETAPGAGTRVVAGLPTAPSRT
ncbi:MAG: ATP-binding protein, partial [Actinomycetota bacterium]